MQPAKYLLVCTVSKCTLHVHIFRSRYKIVSAEPRAKKVPLVLLILMP
jgi:hypothetical protein